MKERLIQETWKYQTDTRLWISTLNKMTFKLYNNFGELPILMVMNQVLYNQLMYPIPQYNDDTARLNSYLVCIKDDLGSDEIQFYNLTHLLGVININYE